MIPGLQYDYPNPSAPVRAIALKTWLSPLKIALASQDAFFGLAGAPNFDQPLPTRARRLPVSLLTHAEPLKLLLQSKDKFFGPTWTIQSYCGRDNAATAGSALAQWIAAVNASGLVHSETVVVGTTSPAGDVKTYSLIPLTISGMALTTSATTFNQTTGQLTSPNTGSESDFQVGTINRSVTITKISSLFAFGFYLQNFNAADQGGTITVTVVDTFNPSGYSITITSGGTVTADHISTSGGGAGVLNGSTPPTSAQFFGFTGLYAASSITISATAAVKYELGDFFEAPQIALSSGGNPLKSWPVPPAPRHWPDLRGFINVPELTLLSKDAFFGLAGNPMRDWPVPKGPIPGISLRTHTEPLKLTLQSQDAFFGLAGHPTMDWPLPTRPAVPSVSLKTWTDPLKIGLAGKDVFFGLGGAPNFDWPVPKTATPGIALRTWTDPLKLELAGKDTFFGLGGAPQFDWKTPGAAPFPLSDRTWTGTFTINLINVQSVAPFLISW